MNCYNDKRGFYRMMLNSDVIVTVIDDETNSQLSAICRNLSATGMAVEIEHPLEISTRVRVRVDSNNSKIQALDVLGQVVRIEEESPDCYLIGVAIEEID